MDDTADLTFLRVWDDEDVSLVKAEYAQTIDAAVTQWVHENRDNVLHLESIAGAPLVIIASRITAWALSTPEIRWRDTQIEAALTEESKNCRMQLGLEWE